MLDYSLVQCSKCLNRSVGIFGVPEGEKTFYCNRHFFARQTVEDKRQQQQEYNQWGSEQWYIDLFPEKFMSKTEDALADLYKKKKGAENRQMKLF